VSVAGESRRPWQIKLPPVEPDRPRWWILRQDSGFGYDPQMPRVQAEFYALGYRWRQTGDELERIVSKSDARKTLETAARQYEMIRDSMRDSWDKTAAMEETVANARMYARAAEFTSAEISEQLNSIRRGDRVIALATVEATSNPDTFPGVLAIVRDPKTARTMPFEQYHALHALESLRPALTPNQLTEVIDLLKDEQWRAPLHEGDPGRLELADRILQGAKRQVGAA